jgi:hypothetical protein
VGNYGSFFICECPDGRRDVFPPAPAPPPPLTGVHACVACMPRAVSGWDEACGTSRRAITAAKQQQQQRLAAPAEGEGEGEAEEGLAAVGSAEYKAEEAPPSPLSMPPGSPSLGR